MPITRREFCHTTALVTLGTALAGSELTRDIFISNMEYVLAPAGSGA